ncbi:hypothetical protein GCM10010324_62130 [Streptomyces hiroshimensis]|uniref:Uncharacterized protein n=1 Tax=Streptomyces hiroshimensis TaxID=66424 RepID=A0ABQ2ZB54_9ACTN|nr:hypothetical protein GCM10010324_62130 [Streptomyces hiroshimensis]
MAGSLEAAARRVEKAAMNVVTSGTVLGAKPNQRPGERDSRYRPGVVPNCLLKACESAYGLP